MTRVALLVGESSNRVYADHARRLLSAELCAIEAALSCPIASAEPVEIGNVGWVVVELNDVTDVDRFLLSNLSGTRALFEIEADERFRPLSLDRFERFSDDLVTIQRYQGKTNELFTHLLLNVTLAASASGRARISAGERARLLDPVAGRGTTLNRALLYDMDVTGIEVNDADVEQYRIFLTTWLKDKRLKHQTAKERIRKGPAAGTSSFTVQIGGGPAVHMVRGSSEDARTLLPGRRFDLLVGDLPYGVQHKAKGGGAPARSPLEFVEAAIDGWHRLLSDGGALGLAWNLRTLPRADLERVVTAAGFQVVTHPETFEHVVDRSITRDVLVATR